MDDLLERAREADRNSVQRMNGSRIFGELADRIERQEAEIRSLREQVEQAELDFADLKAWAKDIAASAEAEIRSLREKLADAYVELSGRRTHASDCATSNAPALEPGRCDCHEDKAPRA
jgi:hypothetical protein